MQTGYGVCGLESCCCHLIFRYHSFFQVRISLTFRQLQSVDLHVALLKRADKCYGMFGLDFSHISLFLSNRFEWKVFAKVSH